MTTTDEERHGGESTGVPALGSTDVGAMEPLGRSGMHHWRQSTITEPGLDHRGNIFFAAVEMTRMPMILTDPNIDDNPIAFANNAFLDLTGYELEEVVGRNCRFLQGSGTDRETVSMLREAVEARQAISIEILNYRRDGSSFWNAVFIGPVFDPDGKLLYFFASQLDVTRRREAEISFRQAQKMESIGQLTAGLAHDFNNLLHIISASLERLATRRDDAKAFDRLHAAASAAAERGAKLTGQLLAFARRSRLEPRLIDLTEAVSSMSELLDATAGTKVQLHLNLKRRLPKVMVDPVHLEMALLNILINARDASSEGGSVTIQTRDIHLNGDAAAHQLEPGDYVRIAVQDEGSGMAPHVKARATEPFFTTKGPGEGTGLGLAMAHGFVQQTGGRLEIHSEVGRGTEIVMLFPVAAERETFDADQPHPKPAKLSATSAPVILVVDDSHEIAGIAADTLGDVGYRVVVAHSGEDGLKRLDEAATDGGFQLVFSDIVMPGGMNGLVFAAEVSKRYPAIPVLLTTGYNNELAVDGPQPQGMDVIGKPYRRNELLDRVQAALRRGVRTGPGRQTSDFGHAEE